MIQTKKKSQSEWQDNLMLTLAAIMSIFGACHTEELCQMIVDNIDDLGTTLVVTIPDSSIPDYQHRW